MAVLGIESSAHTFGAGITEKGKILANEVLMFPIAGKGMIPAKVADFHSKNVARAINAAIRKAKVTASDIDGIGYTKGPGLGPCLGIGYLAARTLSGIYRVPLLPVNHGVAHIEIARHANRFRDPLALYVSGGNSQIVGLEEKPFRHYHIYGETLDIGVGNMIDSFARAAKMNPAWGSTVAKAAESGSYIQMPYTVKGMDFTFTGLLTNAISQLKWQSVGDVAFSLQETAFSMLCEATERALMLTNKRELLVCGGVAQSKRLREMLHAVCMAHGIKFGYAPNEYNADNGAMIALVAEKMLGAGQRRHSIKQGASQRYRIDSVEIAW